MKAHSREEVIETFRFPSARAERIRALKADGYEERKPDGKLLEPGQFRVVDRLGAYLIRLAPLSRRSLAVKRVWAARTQEQREQVAEAIRKSRKGHKQSPETIRKKSESMRLGNLIRSKEEKRARTAKAVAAARSPQAKRKRQETLAKWRKDNPGVPGSVGLTLRQSVLLFFVSHPEASDAECAAAIGRSIQMVARYRKDKIPYKRDLLRPIVRTTPHSEILKFFRGRMPKCPRCDRTAYRVHFDRGLGARWVGHCRCGRSFVLPPGSKPIRPPLRGLDEKQLSVFLDRLAAGESLQTAKQKSGLRGNKSEQVAEMILQHFGGIGPDQWRRSNRSRAKRKTLPSR